MTTSFWWQRDDLRYHEGHLFLGSHNLFQFAQQVGTPAFVYHGARIQANLGRLHAALTEQGLNFQIYYAMKANRFVPILTYLKMLGLCGADVSSPGELDLALQAGFRAHEISHTGTSVSDEDLDYLQLQPDVWINCDSLSVIKRLGERCPGRSIGLRLNPQIGLGYNPNLHYAGAHVTKVGIYQEQFHDALTLAHRYGLTVKTLHLHAGSGYLTDQLENLDKILTICEWFLDQVPTVTMLNLGGGLGVRQTASDKPLDLAAWSRIIAKHLKLRGLKLGLEPGDYIMKDAGVLLLKVNTVEEKHGVTFVGVNGGMNLQNEPAYYQLPLEVVPLQYNDTSARQTVTIAGNINEPIDLFAQQISLPPLAESDFIGLLNVGGYGSSTSSNHSMRGKFGEYLLL